MPANTHGADINEIGLGFFLSGRVWFDDGAKRQHDAKRKLVTKEEYVSQMARASAMADAVKAYLKANYPKLKIVEVYWTARPGSLAAAVGRKDVDSRKNPTDILLRFSGGDSLTGKTFLGLSAKSTQGKTDIGFKNPGLGTMQDVLRVQLTKFVDEAEITAIKRFKLPAAASARKAVIRANSAIRVITQELGTIALGQVRDALLARLKRLSQGELRGHLLSHWMDASTGVYPPYIKVTGMGNKEPYTAKIDNPQSNEKLTALMTLPITLEKNGGAGIGVKAGGKKILKIRAKYESEKVASPVKFSGEPF